MVSLKGMQDKNYDGKKIEKDNEGIKYYVINRIIF